MKKKKRKPTLAELIAMDTHNLEKYDAIFERVDEQGVFLETEINKDSGKILLTKEENMDKTNYFSETEKDIICKESIWQKILDEVDRLVADGYRNGEKRSREQVLTDFLATPKGQEMYDQYRMTYGTVKKLVQEDECHYHLDTLAKAIHEAHPELSYEQCYLKAVESPTGAKAWELRDKAD